MKRVIITGASEGLGEALGRLCIENGIEVVCLSRNAPNYPAKHIAVDLTDDVAITAAAAAINKNYYEFDAIVHCAGVITPQKPDDVGYDAMQQLFKVNVLAPIFLNSQLFSLIRQNGADVLTVGSTVGTKAYVDQAAYGASKWATRGISENLRLELKDTACRVIQFNPGGFKSKAHGPNADISAYMNPIDLAKTMFFILQLPKQVEVSEILINRKAV